MPRRTPMRACCWWTPYDTLRSGVPNAITVFKELREKGHEPLGIGWTLETLPICPKRRAPCWTRRDSPTPRSWRPQIWMKRSSPTCAARGAHRYLGRGNKIDHERKLPVPGRRVQLSAWSAMAKMLPRIKLSDNEAKINPGYKTVYRIYDKRTHKAMADLICLADEHLRRIKPLTIFDPNETWKR